ncbi:MAG: hypothetical protein O3A55_04935 [Bacteroidetes bacterium]|nr:hypothetical protein [Bacteroidota bacterium]
MKKFIFVTFLVFQFTFAQFKNNGQNVPSVSASLLRPMNLYDFQSLIDPSKLQMRHSISMSFLSAGNQNIMLNSYTNSLFYKFNNKLYANVDISVQNSPYNSVDPRLQNQFSGIFINNAELVYKPTKDFHLSFSYQQSPYANYYRNRLLFDDPFGK